MPRKSTPRRIAEGKLMMQNYENAGITNVWPAKKAYLFVRDMVQRLESGRGWSKRQREYFDARVDSPTPVIQSADEELEKKLRAAAVTLGRDGAICLDFAQRLRGGKSLTEKQMAWAQRCLTQAKEITDGTGWQPSEDEMRRMKLIASLRSCYNGMFWDTHPGMDRNLKRLEDYLAGSVAYITEESVEKAALAVKGKLRAVETPRFELGSQAWLKESRWEWDETAGKQIRVQKKSFVLICSTPYPHRGEVCYDVLVNGNSMVISGDRLSKR